MDGWTGNVFMEVEDELSALQIHSIPLLIGHITWDPNQNIVQFKWQWISYITSIIVIYIVIKIIQMGFVKHYFMKFSDFFL